MKSRNSRPAPSHSSASAPRFASFSASTGNGGPPSRSREQLGHRRRRTSRGSARRAGGRAVDEAGQRDHRADGQRGRRSPSAASASPASRARSVEHRRRPAGRGCRPVDERAVALLAGEVGGARRRGSRRRAPARARRRAAASSTGSAGRPTVPRSSTSVSRTSPNSISSPTRLDTVVLFRPVSWAIAARERGPWSATCRSTTPRLWRRTERWLAGARRGSCVGTSGP